MKKEKFSILSVSGFLRICFFILVFMGTESLYSQDEAKIFHRVYLTANTADISSHSSFIPAVQKLLSGTEEPFFFIINGDLIEGKFSKKKSEKITQNLRQLFEQLTQFEKGQIVVIPGDRDWADSEKDGWEDVKKLEKLIKSFDFDNVTWALKKGCPGPKIIKLTEGIYLAAINTQWWNHPHEKPGRTILNVVLGMIAILGLYLAPMYLVGHWFLYAAICLSTALLAIAVLYHTWYLPIIKNKI